MRKISPNLSSAELAQRVVKVKQSCQEYSGECIHFQEEVTDCTSLLKRGILKLKTNAKKESTLKKKKKKKKNLLPWKEFTQIGSTFLTGEQILSFSALFSFRVDPILGGTLCSRKLSGSYKVVSLVHSTCIHRTEKT